MGKRIDLNAEPVATGSGYPAPFDAPCAARVRQRDTPTWTGRPIRIGS